MTDTLLRTPTFNQPDLLPVLQRLDDEEIDQIGFGIIGFDSQGLVQRYNSTESRLAGLRADRVKGLHLFGVVSQCMNNFMVAQRFDDCLAQGEALDATIDYVLTLRMKPTRVKLRLLADPAQATRYICILR